MPSGPDVAQLEAILDALADRGIASACVRLGDVSVDVTFRDEVDSPVVAAPHPSPSVHDADGAEDEEARDLSELSDCDQRFALERLNLARGLPVRKD